MRKRFSRALMVCRRVRDVFRHLLPAAIIQALPQRLLRFGKTEMAQSRLTMMRSVLVLLKGKHLNDVLRKLRLKDAGREIVK